MAKGRDQLAHDNLVLGTESLVAMVVIVVRLSLVLRHGFPFSD